MRILTSFILSNILGTPIKNVLTEAVEQKKLSSSYVTIVSRQVNSLRCRVIPQVDGKDPDDFEAWVVRVCEKYKVDLEIVKK